jgi:hypothetical protein
MGFFHAAFAIAVMIHHFNKNITAERPELPHHGPSTQKAYSYDIIEK